MHGDKSQGQRERALARFERGDVEVLVATDVAARGIDVADIAHVVNFDAPGDRDAYVHRVGRTGRAGRRGAGTSFVLTDQADEMRRIARDLGLSQRVRAEPRTPRQARALPEREAGRRPQARIRPALAAASPQPPAEGVRMSHASAGEEVDLRGLRGQRRADRRRAGAAAGDLGPRGRRAFLPGLPPRARRRSGARRRTERQPGRRKSEAAPRRPDRVRGKPHARAPGRDHRPRLPHLGLGSQPGPSPPRAARSARPVEGGAR